MRTKTIYVAYDDTEFDAECECRKYENEMWDRIHELFQNWELLSKDKNVLCYPSLSLETVIDYINRTLWNYVWYVNVKQSLKKETMDYLDEDWGLVFPPNEKGLYGYNTTIDDWEKID